MPSTLSKISTTRLATTRAMRSITHYNITLTIRTNITSTLNNTTIPTINRLTNLPLTKNILLQNTQLMMVEILTNMMTIDQYCRTIPLGRTHIQILCIKIWATNRLLPMTQRRHHLL